MTHDVYPLEEEVVVDLLAIADAAEEIDGRDPVNEATRLALRHRDIGDIGLWRTDDGFALLIDGELNLVVRPVARNRGLGRNLLEEVLSVAGDEQVSAWAHGNHPAAAVLAGSTGFDRVRDLWLMRRRTDLPLPPVATPDGVVVRTFRPGDEDALLTLNAEAFADHPEQGRMDRSDLDRRMAEPWFDPGGLFLAERDGELLGFHWTKVHQDKDGAPTHGEVYVVGVSSGAQGLGIGKLLTVAGLLHLADLGLPEVVLYVEGDNEPAKAVYSGLGFGHADTDTDVMYLRPSAAGRS